MSKQRNAALMAGMTGAPVDDDPVLPKATRKAPTRSTKATPLTSRRLTAQLSGEVWAVLDALPRTVSAAAFIRSAVLTIGADGDLMDTVLEAAQADADAARSRADVTTS